MNIDFDKIFTERNGGFKLPEVIATSILLVKDIGQAQGIKLSMMEWLKSKNKPVSFLPEIKAVHDHARDISLIGTGGEIREEDFLVLMERCDAEGLSEKFKKPHYRNYKKSLLKLLNQIGLLDGEVIDRDLQNDLERNGLVPEVIRGVEKFINEKGYCFKGQIFSLASAKAQVSENVYCMNFYEGEYSRREKEFFKAIGAQNIEFKTQGKYSALAEVFSGSSGLNFDPESVGFIVSSSMLDEVQRIKHFILQSLTEKGSDLNLNDFTVVCSDEESFKILNNYMYAENIPAYSSYKYSGNDVNTDVLRVFKSGAEGDAVTILNFFNLYIAEKPLMCDDLNGLDLKTLIAKLNKGSDSDYRLKAKGDVKKSIQLFLNAALGSDRLMSAEKALSVIKAKLGNLKTALKMAGKDIETDIYTYEETVKRIFGDTERKFTEYLEYIYIIASKTNSEKLNKDQNGVRIIMMNEPSPAGKVLIFSGITEENFLRSSNPVKIISRDNYFGLYKSVYGKDPEEALYENLRVITSGQTEKTVFFVPRWGEETIPSTKLDRILGLYPKKTMKIEVIPHKACLEDIKADFSVTLSEKLTDKDFGRIDITEPEERPEKPAFTIGLKNGRIEEYLVSPSKIESFMACSAAHVHDLNLQYDKIESQFPYTKGNFYHSVTEKFLKNFKGSDLLDEAEYEQLVSELSKGKGKDKVADSRFGEFADYYVYGIESEDFITPFSTLTDKIKKSGIEEFINGEIKKQTENDPYSYYSHEKLRSGIIRFVAWLMLELGPTPASVTSTFETELKFADFKVCDEPEIMIKHGYIDFLYRDINGTVRIIDIKSNAKFSKFEEEIKNYQKVQILLYREAVSRSIKGENGVNFALEREDIPQDKDCTILDKEYFDKISSDAKVEAAYYSPNKPYRLPVDEQTYDEFLIRLKEKLSCQDGYKPSANSKCEYCSLAPSCPECEESKFDKIEGFNPDADAKPQSLIYQALKAEDKTEKEKTKKFIMFEGQKAEAVLSDENIIVSAGAGAGKTEVLSSRYISLLISTEAGPENIVCITFTKKAAGEMQKRIYSKLSDIIESGYFIVTDKGSDPGSYRLTEKELSKLKAVREEFYDKNLISTFHSFCNTFITEYGYFSDQLKGYDIAQDLSEDFMVGDESVKFLKQQFDTGYIELLSSGLDEKEYEVFHKWLKSRHLIYSGDFEGGFIPDISKLYEEMKLSGKELVPENWSKPIDEYIRGLEERIEKEYGGYFSLREEILGLIGQEKDEKLAALGTKIEKFQEFSYKQAAKKYPVILVLAEELFESEGYQIFNKKSVDLSLNGEEWIIKKAVFSIVQALDEHINGFKKQKGLLEQSDLHIHFLEMLRDGELKEKLQAEFKYILVDEFQDTNRLQDRILESLAGKENRFFLVGDKKQSIYRFQQCDVQIFDKYMKKFNTLYFTDNYRSVPQVVEFNNRVFDKTAPNGYDIIKEDSEISIPASGRNKYTSSVNFINIEKPKPKDIGLTASEIGTISKMCEAAFVADTITENVNKGQKYGSWAVLIRKYTHIGYITEAFRKKNIPYTLILKKDLFTLSEVQEYILILKAVLGLVLPEEIGFIPGYRELIAAVKKNDPLISIIFSIAENEIYKKYIAGFKNSMTKISVIGILKETLISLLTDAENDRERFFTVLEKNMKSNSAGVAVQNPGAVTIMTVHSAKGLEFDNLILANVDENDRTFSSLFNFITLQEGENQFTDYSAGGYSTPNGSGKRNFFINEYIKYKNKYFDDQERANLLYVALTRAKNSLTVMIQTKDDSSTGSGKSEGWAKYLRQFGQENSGGIGGFKYIQKNIGEFDLSAYSRDDDEDPAGTYEAEIEYDLSGHVKTDGLTSATEIAHEQDEVTHEKNNTAALDTGNFVHLFMSKKIKELFRADFYLDTELKDFKKKESEPSSVSLAVVRKMIENIKADQLFRKYVKCGTVLCEKNIVDTQKNLQGYIDLVLLCGNEVIVLDYKTYLYSFPEDGMIGKYEVQIGIYAEALRTVYPDKNIKKYLFFTGRDKGEMMEV
jgi:ATP-dependent exoDNAse (exonuclease V) beta subunit